MNITEEQYWTLHDEMTDILDGLSEDEYMELHNEIIDFKPNWMSLKDAVTILRYQYKFAKPKNLVAKIIECPVLLRCIDEPTQEMRDAALIGKLSQ